MKHIRIVLVFLAILTFSGQSLALGSEDLQSIYNDTVWYRPAGYSVGCTVNLDLNLSGNDNIQKAFNFFVSQGLTPEQSAGIVGNMVQESHVDPTSINPNGGAYGLVQWLGARLDNLTNYAKQHNQPKESLELQLNFVWYELNNSEKSAAEDLKRQTSVQGATDSFFSKYERAGDSSGPARVENAQSVFDKYAGSSGQTVTVGSDLNQDCSAVGPGQDTQYVDGFTVYSQYDKAWVDAPYSSSTVGASGCGPSAMAMIITSLTGRQVTPDETAKYGGDNGTYVPGAGSSWSLPTIIAPHWGLKALPVGANTAKINSALQAGGLIIASGQGPEPFTSGGHYIVIRAVTADGKWKVGDSAHSSANKKDWDPSEILSNMNDGSVYAISK